MPEILSDMLSEEFDVTETAASTFTAENIPLPTAAYSGIGVLIFGIDMRVIGVQQYAAGNRGEFCIGQITEEVEAALVAETDPDLIYEKLHEYHNNAAGTELVQESITEFGIQRTDDPSLAFPTLRDNIRAAVLGSDAGNTVTTVGKVYYKICKFDTKELIMLGFREAFE